MFMNIPEKDFLTICANEAVSVLLTFLFYCGKLKLQNTLSPVSRKVFLIATPRNALPTNTQNAAVYATNHRSPCRNGYMSR